MARDENGNLILSYQRLTAALTINVQFTLGIMVKRLAKHAKISLRLWEKILLPYHDSVTSENNIKKIIKY